MTTIIVAAIALLVLIVLIAIFAGRINIFSSGYDSTSEETKNRVCLTCVDTTQGQICPTGASPHPSEGMIGCSPPKQCCLKDTF